MKGQWNRREVIKVTGAMAAAGWLGLDSLAGRARAAQQALAAGSATSGTLRIAHITDMHIQPERRAGQGVSACLAHIAKLDRRPDLILSGGDMVMDAFESTQARTKVQWDLFTKTLAGEACVPVEYALGNHDIWGQNKVKSGTTGDESQWGKRWALDLLKMAKPYHSFDKGAWHFVVLDSVRPEGDGYVAHLDDEQMDWLEKDLAAQGGKPTLVLSHIPVFAPCSILDPDSGSPPTPSPGLMHSDAVKLHQLFVKHGVRLALSGHIHRLDRAEFQGVTYICDGAVSGAWWRGVEDRCPEGYGVVDLRPDGSFDHRYVSYGWVAANESDAAR